MLSVSDANRYRCYPFQMNPNPCEPYEPGFLSDHSPSENAGAQPMPIDKKVGRVHPIPDANPGRL